MAAASVEVVEVNAAGLDVADNWIAPIGQLDAVAGRLRTEQFRRPVNRAIQL